MKCYLLLIKGSFAEWNKLNQEKRDEVVWQFSEFAKELGKLGYMKGGDGCGERSFRITNPNMSASECLLSPETKDMVTGYFLIETPNVEEALHWAKKCPAFNCGEYVELVPCGH